MADGRNPGLWQKIGHAQKEQEARGVITATRVLRRCFSRAADELWGLSLVGQGVARDLVKHEEAVAQIPPDDLLVLLEGPDGALGLIAASRTFVLSVVEVQTLGMVGQHAPDLRPFTPTDAAMLAPLIDSALTALEVFTDANEDMHFMRGFRFGAMMNDARTASLVLEAEAFELFSLEMDLGSGARQGAMRVFFPVPTAPSIETSPDGNTPGPYAQRLETIPAEVQVVLPVLQLPLSAIQSWSVGDSVALPDGAFDRARLRMPTGHTVSLGKLGRVDHKLAFRVAGPLDPGKTHMPDEPVPDHVQSDTNDTEGPPLQEGQPIVPLG
jgi:flagellar motor switch protein FliM